MNIYEMKMIFNPFMTEAVMKELKEIICENNFCEIAKKFLQLIIWKNKNVLIRTYDSKYLN